MTNSWPAVLQWKIPSTSGLVSRRVHRFSRPAKFEHQGDEWLGDAWSVVIESVSPVSADGSQDVRVHFLVAEGPIEWLTLDRRFSLLEGELLLADGVVT